jgi:hypothetical protein
MHLEWLQSGQTVNQQMILQLDDKNSKQSKIGCAELSYQNKSTDWPVRLMNCIVLLDVWKLNNKHYMISSSNAFEHGYT